MSLKTYYNETITTIVKYEHMIIDTAYYYGNCIKDYTINCGKSIAGHTYKYARQSYNIIVPYVTVCTTYCNSIINYMNFNNLKNNFYKDLRNIYAYITNYILSVFMYFMQLPFVKYVVHKYKYVTCNLPLCDFSEDEFNSTWNIVCMKKCNRYKSTCTVIDPSTPLNKIDCDVVYTLKNGNDIVYFPVFEREIADLDKSDCTLYDILQHRLIEQVFDFDLKIDEKYSKLFGKDYQYFIPYFIDNKFLDNVDDMYKVNAIY